MVAIWCHSIRVALFAPLTHMLIAHLNIIERSFHVHREEEMYHYPQAQDFKRNLVFVEKVLTPQQFVAPSFT